MFSLFFKSYCNSTVWTIGYVVPYHASLLFEHYKIDNGILSMQGKESKHSAIKQELKSCSNRSCSEGDKGKWHQLARSSYIRHFYLPYHFPLDNYAPHFDSRYPLVDEVTCGCFRVIAVNEDVCSQCLAAIELVNNAKNGYLSDKIIRIMKPHECLHCQSRFSDIFMLEDHMKVHLNREIHQNESLPQKNIIDPKQMSIKELKKELSEKKSFNNRFQGSLGEYT